jgi:hypothetical protein
VFTSGGRIVNESGEDVGLNSTSAEVLTALGGPVEEVPVEVADIHAALVTLGLITAEPE